MTPSKNSARHHQNQTPVLSIADFDFETNSTAVISETYKFIIPVPSLGETAEPLVYPNNHPQAGEPIVDYKGEKVGERGIVFFNNKDQSYQAVPDNGLGVIIINEVQPEQASKIDEKIFAISNSLSTLTRAQIKKILDYIKEELALEDVYNSTRQYVRKQLLPAAHTSRRMEGGSEDCYGARKRNSKDVYQATYVPESFSLSGVTATDQAFENGGVVLKHENELWGVQPSTFVRTYRLASGRSIRNLKEDLAVTTIPYQ